MQPPISMTSSASFFRSPGKITVMISGICLSQVLFGIRGSTRRSVTITKTFFLFLCLRQSRFVKDIPLSGLLGTPVCWYGNTTSMNPLASAITPASLRVCLCHRCDSHERELKGISLSLPFFSLTSRIRARFYFYADQSKFVP